MVWLKLRLRCDLRLGSSEKDGWGGLHGYVKAAS